MKTLIIIIIWLTPLMAFSSCFEQLALKAGIKRYRVDEAVQVFTKDLRAKDWDKLKPTGRPWIRLQPQPRFSSTVVLIHGMSDSPHVMKDLSEAYFYRGHNVLVMRLSGHGFLEEYQIPKHMHANLVDWKQDLREAIEIAIGLGGHQPIQLAGFSTGGALAVWGAHTFPSLITDVHLFAPYLLETRKGMFSTLAPMTGMIKHFKPYLYPTAKDLPERYGKFPIHFVHQGNRLSREVRRIAKKTNFEGINFQIHLTRDETLLNNRPSEAFAESLGLEPGKGLYYYGGNPSYPIRHGYFVNRMMGKKGDRENTSFPVLLDNVFND